MLGLRVLFAGLLLSATASAQAIRVGVAVSLKDAMTEIAKSYESETGQKADLTFGSSGQLAAQISNGAQIDVFISAAQTQVDDLTSHGLVVPDSRKVIAANMLVLIVPTDAKQAPASFESLLDLSVKRIAIGEPKSVPAGQYAVQVLAYLKILEPLADRLVYGTNVRQVLAYVERGEVSAGIVYSTDAKESGDKVKVVATARPEYHEPIIYPAVIIKSSSHSEAARKFLEYLASDKARAVLASKGFAAAPKQ